MALPPVVRVCRFVPPLSWQERWDPGGGDGPLATNPGQPVGIDPGTITLHRLNQLEYNNTVRDLSDDTTHPSGEFPSDNIGWFYNNADILTVSPALAALSAEAAAISVLSVATRTPYGGASPRAWTRTVRQVPRGYGAVREEATVCPYA